MHTGSPGPSRDDRRGDAPPCGHAPLPVWYASCYTYVNDTSPVPLSQQTEGGADAMSTTATLHVGQTRAGSTDLRLGETRAG